MNGIEQAAVLGVTIGPAAFTAYRVTRLATIIGHGTVASLRP